MTALIDVLNFENNGIVAIVTVMLLMTAILTVRVCYC